MRIDGILLSAKLFIRSRNFVCFILYSDSYLQNDLFSFHIYLIIWLYDAHMALCFPSIFSFSKLPYASLLPSYCYRLISFIMTLAFIDPRKTCGPVVWSWNSWKVKATAMYHGKGKGRVASVMLSKYRYSSRYAQVMDKHKCYLIVSARFSA